MNFASLVGHTLELIEHIDGVTQPPDRVIAEFLRQKKYLGSHDRRFISEAVFGMIRHRRLIKTLVKQFIKETPTAIDLEGSHVRYLSLYVAYTIAVANKSALPTSLWNVCFPKIDLQNFAEWLQRNCSLDFLNHDEVTRFGVKFSFENWMVKEWISCLGSEVEQLLATLNTPAPTTIRVNLTKTTREDCQKRLSIEGIETAATQISPVGLVVSKRFNAQTSKTFKDGWFEIQDEGSQLISFIANPKPGEIVIDGCAGGGGKSLHIGDLMHNEGDIIAVDIHPSRLKELEVRAKRSGIHIIKTQLAHSTQSSNLNKRADIVLVDAPCSGVGTIRRNPWLKWSVAESLVQHFSNIQREILDLNSQFVKPGGRLIYATCSFFLTENESVVTDFLQRHSEFELIDLTEQLKDFGLSYRRLYVNLYPHHHNTDGFFAVAMRRIV